MIWHNYTAQVEFFSQTFTSPFLFCYKVSISQQNILAVLTKSSSLKHSAHAPLIQNTERVSDCCNHSPHRYQPWNDIFNVRIQYKRLVTRSKTPCSVWGKKTVVKAAGESVWSCLIGVLHRKKRSQFRSTFMWFSCCQERKIWAHMYLLWFSAGAEVMCYSGMNLSCLCKLCGLHHLFLGCSWSGSIHDHLGLN